MIVFFLFLACMASVLGYAIALVVMAILGDSFAKAIIKFIVISWIVLMVLIYLIAYT